MSPFSLKKPEGSPKEPWRVHAVAPPAKQPILRRLLGRKEPTTYQRCLAVHLHFASPRGGLS